MPPVTIRLLSVTVILCDSAVTVILMWSLRNRKYNVCMSFLDVANAAYFLASTESSYITGSSIEVTGKYNNNVRAPKITI